MLTHGACLAITGADGLRAMSNSTFLHLADFWPKLPQSREAYTHPQLQQEGAGGS